MSGSGVGVVSNLSSGTIIGDGKYVLGTLLGSGSHGDVYQGIDLCTTEEVAIKLESWDCEELFLSHEYHVYKFLEGGEGIPLASWFGQQERHNVMSLQLLGDSLATLYSKCGNKFTLKTVLMIADQVLQRVEYLHAKGFIHRSLKPENFSVGRNDPSFIYLIDFGNAKRYRNKLGEHIACKMYNELGLANCHSRHQSIAALQRMERSRRDDLESIGYMLIYFLKGSLPWDHVLEDPVGLKNVKMQTPIKVLCQGCPAVFYEYMTYVRSLTFEEAPDYSFLRDIFSQLSKSLGIVPDGQFDWVAADESKDMSKTQDMNNNAIIEVGKHASSGLVTSYITPLGNYLDYNNEERVFG